MNRFEIPKEILGTVKPITVSSFRNERKFLVSLFDNYDLEHLVKMHPAMFSEIFYLRQVNNIYLDTHNFQYYQENVSGSARRMKVRIRWYGDLFGKVAKPVLELKIKEGFVNRKESFVLKPFVIEDQFKFESLTAVFDDSDLPPMLRDILKSLEPTLLNKYRRKYFMSADGNFRITVDSDLEFFEISKNENSFLHSIKEYNIAILELKYMTKFDDQADLISGFFPLRMTRSSKYVRGIESLY